MTTQNLIKKLGTTSGSLAAIGVLLAMFFGAGVYFNNGIKNIEILQIQKDNFTELQKITKENVGEINELNLQISILKIENKNCTLKLTENGKSKKK